MKNQVLIAGGTGLVGQHLIPHLKNAGYDVAVLTRGESRTSGGVTYLQWDPHKEELPDEHLRNATHVVNLAGRNISEKRWTKSFKEELYKSRIHLTRFLIRRIRESEAPVKTLINASATNYYGYDLQDEIDESHGAGTEFLAGLCADWEKEALEAEKSGIRVCIFRNGIVLQKQKGALGKMETAVKLGAGSPLASGNQYMSWIHIDDISRMHLWAIENSTAKGAYNATAPEPVTNRELTRCLAKTLNRPFFLPAVPAPLLKLILGELGNVLTGSLKVIPKKLTDEGFTFRYPGINAAIQAIYNDQKGRE